MRGARLIQLGTTPLVMALACSRSPASGGASVRASVAPNEPTAIDSTQAGAGVMGRGTGPGMGRGMMRGHGAMMGVGDTTVAPRPQPAPAVAAAGCPAIDATLVKSGRQIFTGPGNCQMCHGADARGTSLAPNLTDTTWLDIDGSYAAIAGLVRQGVPRPKRYPAPMPAMGGAALTPNQVCAVAAYIYSLGH